MRENRISSLASLVRQGIALEVGYGTHSLEALLWVAETVEEGVYARGSLRAIPGGIAFRLQNPPLRVGAFRELRVAVDGRSVETSAVRVRTADGSPWRPASAISRAEPLELAPGRPTELEVDGVPARGRRSVRIELTNVAIPPLVWLEFEDDVGGSG